MRIALLGQAAFGADVFKALHPRYDIVGVFCPPDSPKGKVDPLKEAAQEAGVPVMQPRKMKDPEAYEQMKKLAPDLAILAFVTDIVPGRVLELPRTGQHLLSSFPSSQTSRGIGHKLGGDRWRCQNRFDHILGRQGH